MQRSPGSPGAHAYAGGRALGSILRSGIAAAERAGAGTRAALLRRLAPPPRGSSRMRRAFISFSIVVDLTNSSRRLPPSSGLGIYSAPPMTSAQCWTPTLKTRSRINAWQRSIIK